MKSSIKRCFWPILMMEHLNSFHRCCHSPNLLAFSSAVSLPSCTRSWHRRSTSCSSFAAPSINLQWEKVHPFGPILSDILKKWLQVFEKWALQSKFIKHNMFDMTNQWPLSDWMRTLEVQQSTPFGNLGWKYSLVLKPLAASLSPLSNHWFDKDFYFAVLHMTFGLFQTGFGLIFARGRKTL